ncbi:deoR-like helix-turn-helix domain-containing protein [Ditylenchus destructor]|nr:deoR-like helix-turn-helix domain-containing protein [Ditylenchus destructor]
MADGRAEAGPLLGLLREHFGLKHDLDVCAAINGAAARSRLAQLARLVSAAAVAGDAQAAALLGRAGEELALLAAGVARQLDLPGDAAVEVSYTGGVFEAGDAVTGALRAAMARTLPNATLVAPRFGPELGAAMYAARIVGARVQPDLNASPVRAFSQTTNAAPSISFESPRLPHPHVFHPHPGAAPAEKPEASLLIDERRQLIRDQVQTQGRVTVEELAERFGISVVTIRSDLNALASSGALMRTHGGALAHRDSEEVPISVKQKLRHEQKVRIAIEAAKLIKDGETIMLDSGSTTEEIAKQIRGMRLQSLNVITNALNIAVLLATVPGINVVMPGGLLRQNSYSLSGPQAVTALQSLYADRLFLGVDSLDPDIGLMTPHLLEAQLNAQMMKIARQVVAVADASKLMKRNLSVIAPVEQLDILITDDEADAAIVAELRRRGVDVVLA